MAKIFSLKTTGESMFPTIKEGEIVIVKENGELAKGDIIVYKKGEKMIVHRILEISGNTFRTKADSQLDPDPYVVYKNEILGKVEYVVSTGGGILKPSPQGSLLLKKFKSWGVKTIRTVNRYKFYNLLINMLTVFSTAESSNYAVLMTKREIVSGFRPYRFINIWLIGIPVASVYLYENGERYEYVRSPFINSNRFRQKLNLLTFKK